MALSLSLSLSLFLAIYVSIYLGREKERERARRGRERDRSIRAGASDGKLHWARGLFAADASPSAMTWASEGSGALPAKDGRVARGLW